MQGRRLRSQIGLLPAAGGPTTGETPSPDGGPGTPLRVAVVGDSTAAGCGADNYDEAFPGQFARDLAARDARPVAWSVVAQPGATARRVRYRLLDLVDDGLDVAVLAVGGNDVLSRRAPNEWREDVTTLVEGLGERARTVVVIANPRFILFPAVPGTLGRYFDEQARVLDAVTRQVCAEHSRAVWVDLGSVQPGEAWFYSQDGFHPSSAGYRAWASAVAEAVPDLIEPVRD